MQIYALDASASLTKASQAIRHIDYFCPQCEAPLRLRGGSRTRLHFYHKDPSPHCRLSGKSLTHLAVQTYVQNTLSPDECLLEKRCETINRIADCFWVSQNIVFEIQCSFITYEEVKARIKDYESLGYKVIWIFHDKQFNRFRKSAAEHFLRSSLYLYTNINENGQGIVYTARGKIICLKEVLALLRQSKKLSFFKRFMKYLTHQLKIGGLGRGHASR